MNRVAITGLSAICGLGHNASTVWENALAAKSGISTITHPPAEGLPVQIAGEVKDFEISPDILSPREAARYDRFLHLALAAGFEAFHHAGLNQDNLGGYDATRVGTILGVGLGGMRTIEDYANLANSKGVKRIGPFFIPAIIPSMATGLLSIKLGLRGVNYVTCSACASSNHALTQAYLEIQLGRHDVVISGGAESALSYLPLGSFANMKALSKRNHEPQKASRPFDIDRDGFVMGEGAGILVLENAEKARARGATIYAELVGTGASSDAHHITAPHPQGEGARQCMEQALAQAGVPGEEIDYVNAHGTSTKMGDRAETLALKDVFGNHAHHLSVSSTKSMTGHLLGAAGGLESVFCVQAINTGKIPPTINLDNQDPECDLNYVPHKSIEREIRYALNNSFGFGGTNSSLLFKRP